MPRAMSNKEAAEHIRKWAKAEHKPLFGWPTDACGYEQHIKFVDYRNNYWTEEQAKLQSFDEFVLEYADKLEADAI